MTAAGTVLSGLPSSRSWLSRNCLLTGSVQAAMACSRPALTAVFQIWLPGVTAKLVSPLMAYSMRLLAPLSALCSMAASLTMLSGAALARSSMSLSCAAAFWAGIWASTSPTMVSTVRWRASCACSARPRARVVSIRVNIFFITASGFKSRVCPSHPASAGRPAGWLRRR